MKSILFTPPEQFRVFVYRNLSNGMWSVKALEGEHAGKVVLHAHNVSLGGTKGIRQGKPGIEFRVSEAGRQRVLREKQKNVHAGVVGYMFHAVVDTERYPVGGHAVELPEDSNALECTPPGHPAYREVTYNPYKFEQFVFADTLEPAVISDPTDEDVQLEANGKVYVQSLDALTEVVLGKG